MFFLMYVTAHVCFHPLHCCFQPVAAEWLLYKISYLCHILWARVHLCVLARCRNLQTDNQHILGNAYAVLGLVTDEGTLVTSGLGGAPGPMLEAA